MLWLIDDGDAYHQMISLAISGDENPESVVVDYRNKLAAHCKDYKQLEEKIKKTIGPVPRLSHTCTGDYQLAEWKAAYSKWYNKLQAYVNAHLTHQAPNIKSMLQDAGYKVVEHQITTLRE